MNNATSYYRTSGEQDGQLTSTLPSGSTSNTNVRYSSNDNSDGTIQLDTSISQTSHTIKKKRKNTNVACVNCSRNHSSCEQKRPCSRCIKKGIANTCVDAPRKKKKYLEGIDTLPIRVGSNTPHYGTPLQIGYHSASFIDNQQYGQTPRHSIGDFNDIYPTSYKSYPENRYNVRNDQAHRFQSYAANSEYSVLSTIVRQNLLNNNNHQIIHRNRDTITSPGPIQSYNSISSELNSPSIDGTLDFKRIYPSDPSKTENTDSFFNTKINQYYVNNEFLTFPELKYKIDSGKVEKVTDTENYAVSVSVECPPPDGSRLYNNVEWDHSLKYGTPVEIYKLINEPFSHTPGFRHLLQYLRKRFSQKDLVSMCQNMAYFRPIFIACSITLTEEDMIFMEQCYQRTLLQYVKFIQEIGTPTVVWRRNGQISYVNDEFEILSGWKREELLDKMSFIVEIIDDESVREYFKTFARIAYNNIKGSEQMDVCRLLTPIRNQVIECKCIWTLKRDMSGLPLMILGNFLPVL
ncbi:Zn(2)-C6 fungal-type DNA-binding domain signature [Nakaseomyces glabratus]